jgi:eukaryotic-like serine/threonine-protein kinase
MGESISPSDVFNELAYEFAERLRHGERPSLTEYTERHPELADDIRDLFPTLVIVEQLGSAGDKQSDPTTDRSQLPVPIPERLGDYRILREIGRGGMGIVYEAEQESLGRHVALKVLTQHRHAGPIHLMRFQREARAVALLHHTNIVPVFGVGVDDGTHYYAMQYIHGRSLDAVVRELVRVRGEASPETALSHGNHDSISARLARGLITNRFGAQPAGDAVNAVDSLGTTPSGNSSAPVLPLADAESTLVGGFSSTSSIFKRKERQYYRSVARLGLQAAEALAHAHGHGVVHRDIKPANLLLDLQGIIWVTDFGLAKAEGAEELTSPGDVVGTLRYMAPERFHGESDERCDIYSLGVSLYEMLTLRPAFPASFRHQLIKSIIDTEPPRPRKFDPQIPRDLETIVLKAIAKRPADRFSSASEMARELGRFVEHRPIRSRRVSAPERLWRWSRRNPAVAMLTILAMLLTTVLAITSTTAAWKFRDQRDAVRKEQRNTQAELGHALLQQGRALRYSRQPGRRADGLEILDKAARIASDATPRSDLMEKLRDEAIATLAETDEQQVRTWPGLNLPAKDVSISLDADRYVVVENEDSLHVHRLSDRAEIQVVKSDHASALSWPMLVPGGRFVVAMSGSTEMKLWDLERGELAAAWPADVRGAMCRPDGKQIAAVQSDGDLSIYDLPAMTQVHRFNIGSNVARRVAYERLAWSRDGRFLAFLGPEAKNAAVYEAASGRVVLDLKIPTAHVHRTLALSQNGGVLAVTHDRAISIYDVANGERLAMLQGHQSEGINAQFQPDGDLLASECWDGNTRLWDPIRGRLLITLPGSFRGWVGNGSHLLIGRDQDLILYQITQAAERRTIDCRMLSEHAGAALFGPARVVFSPDGEMLAMALRPEGVRIVRASDGVGLAHLPIGYCDEVLYLPDGSLLTCNDHGLCRWPVRRMRGDTLRMGPPEPLAAVTPRDGYVHTGLAADGSGRLIGIAAPAQQGSVLVDSEQPWRRTCLVPHRLVSSLTISPNGRWVATAGLEPSGDNGLVKVWDAATGQLLVELPTGYSQTVFSPDGQWLALSGVSRYRLFKTGSWSPGPEVDYGAQHGCLRMSFHPDGRLAALLDTIQPVVRLVEVETGRVLATFESPDESNLYCVVFSPDGRFIAASHADQRVELWDLSSIRSRLEKLNLAAGVPDIFSGSSTGAHSPAVDRIEIEGANPAGLRLLAVRHTLRHAVSAIREMFDASLADAAELRARAARWVRLGQWRLAVIDYRASLARQPDVASAANNLSWCLASMPGRGDPDEAVRWAQKAVDLVPNNPHNRNTLGVALYRAGRFAEAAILLDRNIAQDAATSGYDWVFLAMCKQRLGQAGLARHALARARQWRDLQNQSSPLFSAEFDSLLQEAQGLVDESLPDFPADVFGR